MADIDEVKDLAATLNSLINRLAESTNTVVDGFERSVRSAGGLHGVLEELVLTSGEVPKNIKTADELQRKLTTDTRLFSRLEGEIHKTQKKMIGDYYQRAVAEMYKQVEATEDMVEQARIVGTTMAGIRDVEEQVTGQLQRQLALMKRQQEAGAGFFENVRDFVREFDSGNPLLKIYDTYKKIQEFSKRPGGAAAIFGGVALIATTKTFAAATDLLKAAFMETYDFLDKKVMPTNAELNKSLGNMGSAVRHARGQAVETGVAFEQLGLSFEQGRDAVIKLHAAMMTTALSNQTLKASLKLSEYVGLGAEQTGKLMMAFEKTGVSIEQVNVVMTKASKIAFQYGVPVNQVRRDLGENIDLLARFGTANAMEMAESAAKVRQYGLTIKEVNAAFGKAMDTFDKTSDTSAKLNAVFGTNINSFKLMMETNPEKRMAMVRKELDRQKISWEKLNPFEKNVLTTTLGVTEEQAQLAFASEKTRRQLEKQLAERKRAIKIDEDWNKGLSNIKRTLIAWEPLIQNLLRSVGTFVAKLLGFNDTATPVMETTKSIEMAIQGITKYIDGLDPDPIVELQDGLKTFNSTLRDVHGLIMDISDAWHKTFSPINSRTAEEMVQQLQGGLLTNRGEFMEKLNDPEVKAQFERYLGRLSKGQRDAALDLLDDRRGAAKKFGQNIAEAQGKKASIDADVSRLEKALKKTKDADMKRIYEATLARSIEEQAKVNDKIVELLQWQKENAEDLKNNPIVDVNDALITKTGEIVRFNPQDNILAIKDLMGLQAAAQQRQPTQSSAGVSDVRIEVVDINMDGKKVGEAQIRISRQ